MASAENFGFWAAVWKLVEVFRIEFLKGHHDRMEESARKASSHIKHLERESNNMKPKVLGLYRKRERFVVFCSSTRVINWQNGLFFGAPFQLRRVENSIAF